MAQDTGISQVTLGPEASFTWHENLSADLGVDFPVVQNNTSLQAVEDYRVSGPPFPGDSDQRGATRPGPVF